MKHGSGVSSDFSSWPRAYAGFRNVAGHAGTPWAEHEAIEYLAVLSVIARWVEETVPCVGG